MNGRARHGRGGGRGEGRTEFESVGREVGRLVDEGLLTDGAVSGVSDLVRERFASRHGWMKGSSVGEVREGKREAEGHDTRRRDKLI